MNYRNVVFNEDCFVGMTQIPDNSIDLVVTDPPYWHKKSPGKPYSQRNQCHTKSKFSNSSLYSQDCDMMKSMSDFDENSINRIMQEFKRLCKIMNCYIFCNETQVPYYAMWAERNGYMFTILVWEKPLSIINKNRFSQNTEFIVRIYDYGTALNRINGLNFLYNRVKKDKPVTEKHHPCEKPVSLVEQFILLSSNKGDVILDPFCGSGTTALACIANGRDYLCYENEKKYFDIAIKRVNNKKKELTLF